MLSSLMLPSYAVVVSLHLRAQEFRELGEVQITVVSLLACVGAGRSFG
jgi:hypothetical protein